MKSLNFEFKNKTYLITGAGSGIGRATAKLFYSQGANLILVGRQKSKLESLQSELSKLDLNEKSTNEKGTVEIYSFDLSQTQQIDSLYQNFNKKDLIIDGYVNNAAIEGKIGSIDTLTLADFDECYNINVKSLWYSMQKQVQLFLKNKNQGTIVNISSIAGFKAIPESSLYVSSKHAVLGITKSVALEQIKHGIRVNAVCPGPVDTPMLDRIIADRKYKYENSLPTKRSAKPEEIGEAILWLSSPKSSYVVGSSFVVDGGTTI